MSENLNRINVKSVIQVDTALLDDISNLIEAGSLDSLLNILTDLHPADIAEIINHLSAEDASKIFKLLDTETAGEVIIEVDENLREYILSEIDKKKITDIIDELDTDDATDIVADLPENIQEHVLDNIDKEYSEDVKELLKYPEDSAGGIMNSTFVAVLESHTIKDAIDEIRKFADDIDHIYQLYVLKPTEELIGTVLIKALLINPLDTRISSVMEEDLIYVTPEVDQEEVAKIMEKYDLVAIPVVNEQRKMIGRITIDDIVDVINEEAAEDIQKIAGLSEEEEYNYSAYRISTIRLPWLLVSLFGEMISAYVLQSFHATIERIYIAGVFIPIIMAMGGSAGTQSAIVVVRGLATDNLWLSESYKRLFKELRVATINGFACGLILLVTTTVFWQEQFNFTLILSVSLVVIMINATMIGAFIPLFLKRLKFDPAISTGPFVQTANDIVGLIIYFTLITIFYVP